MTEIRRKICGRNFKKRASGAPFVSLVLSKGTGLSRPFAFCVDDARRRATLKEPNQRKSFEQGRKLVAHFFDGRLRVEAVSAAGGLFVPNRHISLSHCPPWSALLDASTGPVGIDLETIVDSRVSQRAAMRIATLREAYVLEAAVNSDYATALWTRKEAWYKVRGKFGGLELRDVDVSPGTIPKDGRTPGLRVFTLRLCSPDAYVSIAVSRETRTVRVRTTGTSMWRTYPLCIQY